MNKIFSMLVLLLSLSLLTLADNPAQSARRPPVVVAAPNFLNQTTAFPSTVIFTPTASGRYRISLYVEASPNQFSGQFIPQLSWTDDFRLEQGDPACVGPYCNGDSATFQYATSEMNIFVKSGTPISLSSAGSPAAGQTYNLFVTIEQL